MQISLPNIKISHSVPITKITNDADGSIKKHMMNLGFSPGRQVTLVQKSGDGFIAKIDTDNPIAIKRDLADSIIVNAKEEDLDSKKGVFDWVKKLFKRA